MGSPKSQHGPYLRIFKGFPQSNSLTFFSRPINRFNCTTYYRAHERSYLASALGTKKTIFFRGSALKYDLFISYAQQWITLDGCGFIMDTRYFGKYCNGTFQSFCCRQIA